MGQIKISNLIVVPDIKYIQYINSYQDKVSSSPNTRIRLHKITVLEINVDEVH